jgi:hypothetical protein
MAVLIMILNFVLMNVNLIKIGIMEDSIGYCGRTNTLPPPFVEELSDVAKLVWSYMQYTSCKIDDNNASIIEIKHVWGLINDIEEMLKEKQETIDLNIKTNMELVVTIQRMIDEKKPYLGFDAKEKCMACGDEHIKELHCRWCGNNFEPDIL